MRYFNNFDAFMKLVLSMKDGFGNTLISKDEAAGTWTESTYKYGSEDNGGSETEEDTPDPENETTDATDSKSDSTESDN